MCGVNYKRDVVKSKLNNSWRIICSNASEGKGAEWMWKKKKKIEEESEKLRFVIPLSIWCTCFFVRNLKIFLKIQLSSNFNSMKKLEINETILWFICVHALYKKKDFFKKIFFEIPNVKFFHKNLRKQKIYLLAILYILSYKKACIYGFMWDSWVLDIGLWKFINWHLVDCLSMMTSFIFGYLKAWIL